ncbi:MAG: TIGR04076 family protein [Atopobiaceae bacterium]|nr:TIGR04076 family protein [Atopobiaceae bacterium]
MMPQCSEAWDAISRYIYTGLQGGSIMRGWMERENEMICCCSDGTRPFIFKVEIASRKSCSFRKHLGPSGLEADT